MKNSIILFVIGLLIISFTVQRDQDFQNKKEKSSLYQIKRIMNAGESDYIIYAERNDSTFKILSTIDSAKVFGSEQICIGHYYSLSLKVTFPLDSLFGKAIAPNLGVIGIRIQENVVIEIEKESHNKIYFASNLNGLFIDSEPKEFSELARDTYFLRNASSRFTELCNQLNDTIVNSKIPFYLNMLTEINEIDKSVSWAFDKRKQEILQISDRLIFRVCIKDSGTLYVNHVECNLSEIKNMASQYIYYPNDIDKDIIQKKVEIEGFGAIDVSIAGVEICCDTQKNNGLSQNKWKLLFDCIHQIMLVIEEQRDKISIERFGQKYESLSFDKKVIFADIIGYPLRINFFDECYDWRSYKPIN